MPAIRTVVLTEGDKWIGTAQVPDSTMLIKHQDELFYRSHTAVRLSGGGIGIIFSHIEPLVRDKLNPI